MITLRTWQDLLNARQSNLFPEALQSHLEAEFKMLNEHLGDGNDLNHFDLTIHGPMWVTSNTDKKLDWQYIAQKMAVHEPEFVELRTLQNGQKALRIGFLADNDHMPLLYTLTDCLHPEVVAWLEAYGIDNDDQINEYPDDEAF